MVRSLQNSLDRDVYQIVRKIDETEDSGRRRLTVWSIYEYIRKSNSSLSRQKRKPLEDSIERVLKVWRQDQQALDDDDDDDDEEIEQNQRRSKQSQSVDSNLLNRQLVRRWQLADKKQGGEDGEETTEGRSIRSGSRDKVEKMSGTSRKRLRRSQSPEDRTDGDGENQPPSPGKKKQKAPGSTQLRMKPKAYEVIKAEEAQKPFTVRGIDDVVAAIEGMVFGMTVPSERTNRDWLSSLLLSGPLLCGKATVVRFMAQKWKAALVYLRCSILLQEDKAEKILLEIYEQAMSLGRCVIHLADFDILWESSDSRNSSPNMSLHHLWNFLVKIDETPLPVVVIATTKRPEQVPSDFCERFFEETFAMKLPNEITRQHILEGIAEVKGYSKVDYGAVAHFTHGYVAGDLGKLARRVSKESAKHNRPATLQDWEKMAKSYKPFIYAEGFTKIPDVTLDDVGGLSEVVRLLERSIINPIKAPQVYERASKKPGGILLWGPPGCGKTFVAQAVANAAQAGFILVNGPELLDKYVGESERKIRELFARAVSCAPCLIFFDEFDSLVPNRSRAGTEASTRVVNTFLVELDGAKSRAGVFVMAATNRPELIDPAMLRPGRFDRQVYVDFPSSEERGDIMRKTLRPDFPDCREEELALAERVARSNQCNDFSGADISGLCTEAISLAIERGHVSGPPEIQDWEQALEGIGPSVDESEVESYRSLRDRWTARKNKAKNS